MNDFLAPGIHLGLSDDTYHSDPCSAPSLSSTLARKIINQSPLHAWTASARLNPGHVPQIKKTFDLGKAIHRAILGRGGDYVAYPDELLASNGAASTAAAKTWAEEQRAAGRTPLKAEEVDRIGAIADHATRALAEMGITFDPERAEVTAIAEIDGVTCRALIDSAPADPRIPLRDLKSCEDASPDACIRAVETYGLDVQAAHYLDVWKAATGEDRRFEFVFVEKTEPFEVCVVRLLDDPAAEADWMLSARSKIAEARRIWRECLEANHWPGYPRRIAIIGARSFYLQRWAERETGQPIPSKPSAAALRASHAAQAPEAAE